MDKLLETVRFACSKDEIYVVLLEFTVLLEFLSQPSWLNLLICLAGGVNQVTAVQQKSGSINSSLSDRRERIEHLNGTRNLLRKAQVCYSECMPSFGDFPAHGMRPFKHDHVTSSLHVCVSTVQYILDLPKRLRALAKAQNYSAAVKSYTGSLPVLQVQCCCHMSFSIPGLSSSHVQILHCRLAQLV